ncbi:hypothetical protein [Anaeroarcus burkinensis]|uniref:hypothetical protein n=1 Tax=Anaeroarcus burkinensis TaxID=82376 RepID=UPI0004295299|nr:hypothetical protein [Anaeroarcus burkinensis]
MLDIDALEMLQILVPMFESDSESKIFGESDLQELNLYKPVPVIKGDLDVLQNAGLASVRYFRDDTVIKLTPLAFREHYNLKKAYPVDALLKLVLEVYDQQSIPDSMFSISMPDDPETYLMSIQPYWQLQERKLATITQSGNKLQVFLTEEGVTLAMKHHPLSSQSTPPASMNFNGCTIGVAAANASNFNVNNIGTSIEELRKKIDENLSGSSDHCAAVELANTIESGNLSKGFLKKFSDLIAKHGWLSGAVAQALLRKTLE